MRDLLLVEKTGVRAHFARLSYAKSVEMIADAKSIWIGCDGRCGGS